MEDEIDLRDYVRLLFRRWKLIIVIFVIIVCITALVSFLLPPVYEARASVLITTTNSEIAKTNQSKEAIIALVKSPSVANIAVKQLGDRLDPTERGTSNILGKVRYSNEGDIITIYAKSNQAGKAAMIADAWADSYKKYVNNIYIDLLQNTEELEVQANAAMMKYETAQKALEAFIRDGRIIELERQNKDTELLYQAKQLREQIQLYPTSVSASAINLAFLLLQTRALTYVPDGVQISIDTVSNVQTNSFDITFPYNTSYIRMEIWGGSAKSLVDELELRKKIN